MYIPRFVLVLVALVVLAVSTTMLASAAFINYDSGSWRVHVTTNAGGGQTTCTDYQGIADSLAELETSGYSRNLGVANRSNGAYCFTYGRLP